MTSPSSSGRTRAAADETDCPRVLIVDDDERNLKLARDVLGAAGFQTLGAASGTAGLAVAIEQRPDVILMDIRLPDLDGTLVARRLKEDSRTAAIPVVALTALRSGECDWLRDAGFDGVLEKPINVAEFPRQVRELCR